MANSGSNAATIAYKFDSDENPLDVNGAQTAVSGKKQAILLRQGFANPNGSLYEVEGFFNYNVNGDPTTQLNTTACPIGVSSPWVLDGGTWHNSAHWYNNRIWQTI